MATFEIKIADDQFSAGGKFYGMDEIHTGIVINGYSENYRHNTIEVTKQSKSINQININPHYREALGDILRLLDEGIIEFSVGGATKTAAEVITIFRTWFQEI